MTTKTTDSEGKTSFTNILSGIYAINISKEGYNVFTDSLIVKNTDVDKSVDLERMPTFIWDSSIASVIECVDDCIVLGSGGGQVDYDDGTVLSLVEGANTLYHNYTDTTKLYNIIVTNIISLEDYCFKRSNGLNSVYLPGVTILGKDCFNNCSNLFYASLPDITNLEEYSFFNCTNLVYLYAPNVTTLGEDCFEQCTSLNTVSLPNVITLEDYCFNYCTGLTNIELPKAVNIGSYCFNNCTNLQRIELPETTVLDKNCFSKCNNLTEAVLSKVTGIGKNAFKDCTSLTSVRFGTSTPPSLGADCFSGVPSSCKVYCPNGSKTAYENVFNNYGFSVIEY